MRAAALASALLLAALAASGCSGSSDGAAGTNTPTTEAQAKVDAAAALTRAARAAVLAHHRLSVRILWTNEVPEWPRVVGGPALRALRQAAADRTQRGIRVRLVREDFRIVSLRLDPSYASATAIVLDRQTGALYRGGRRLRKPVELRERARVELRRIGRTTRFVVWEVTLTR